MTGYIEKAKKAGMDWNEMVPLELDKYKDLIEKLSKEPARIRTKTGIPTVDDLTGGFEEGRLYVLGAPPKQGKSTLMFSMMYEMSKQKKKSVIFSYEMGWREVVRKFMDMERHDGKKPGQIDLPMYIPINLHRIGGDLQLQWLFEAVARAKEEGCELAIIDHLHFLFPPKDFNNFSVVVGGVVRQIKRMAEALQIPVFLIVPLKKVENDAKPTFWDIRDSSMIMHEADSVFIMYRHKNEDEKRKVTDDSVEEIYTNKSILSLELDRETGNSAKVALFHNGAYFESWTEEHDKQKNLSEFAQAARKAKPYGKNK